mgnify:CR=1 FL=1
MNIKIKAKRIILLFLAVFVIILGTWCLWPHPLAKVILSDTDTVTSLACNVNISGIETGGTPFIDSYALQELSKNNEHFTAIMGILNSSEYRQDIRNLSPWPITEVTADGKYTGKSANVFLVWGNTEEETCYLHFAGNSVIVSRGVEDRLLIYRTTNPDILNKLLEYLQTHGTKN